MLLSVRRESVWKGRFGQEKIVRFFNFFFGLLSGKFPNFSVGLIFGFREEDVDRLFVWINPGDELLEGGLGHGGAASSGLGATAPPDVEENSRSGSGSGLGWWVVSDEEFKGMGVISLLHLLGPLPLGFGLMLENEMSVVVGRTGIFDPKIAAGDFSVREPGVLFDRLGVSPGSTDIEETGGGFHVSLTFAGGSGRWTIDTFSPGRAGAAKAGFKGAGNFDPLRALFFVEEKTGVGTIPSFGNSNDGLPGARRNGEERCREKKSEEKKRSHGGKATSYC